jgi:chemotaxis protein CheD
MQGTETTRTRKTYISQGEFAVGEGENEVIATLLGSCVSACLWDAQTKVGGMNHVVFSGNVNNAQAMLGHAVNGMELLINNLLRKGASRGRLQAKVFGGARMISGLTDAGEKNGEFVLDFLSKEGIPHIGGDIGGRQARRLEFWPGTGRARMKLVQERVEEPAPEPQKPADDIELF